MMMEERTTGTEPGDLREWDAFKGNAFTPEELANWMQAEDWSESKDPAIVRNLLHNCGESSKIKKARIFQISVLQGEGGARCEVGKPTASE